jgi:two-component system response regulator YesN
MKKILIVDDEPIPRKILRGIVSWNNFGYEIVGEAANGKAALALVEKFCPDVIFADITMPVMNGIEFIRRLREMNNPAKIIILSCHEDFNYVREALRLGAVDYLLKHTLEVADILSLVAKLTLVFNNEQKENKGINHLEQVVWGRFISEMKTDLGCCSQKIRRAARYIQENYFSPVTLDSIASYAGIIGSNCQFCGLFLKHNPDIFKDNDRLSL